MIRHAATPVNDCVMLTSADCMEILLLAFAFNGALFGLWMTLHGVYGLVRE
jgi:hypothetical protein